MNGVGEQCVSRPAKLGHRVAGARLGSRIFRPEVLHSKIVQSQNSQEDHIQDNWKDKILPKNPVEWNPGKFLSAQMVAHRVGITLVHRPRMIYNSQHANYD